MSFTTLAPARRYILGCLVAAGLAVAAQADESNAATDTAAEEAASPSVLIVETVPVHRPALEGVPDEIADQQITCTWEAPVGSRVLRKRCVTEEHRRIVSQAWQEWLRQVQMAFTYN